MTMLTRSDCNSYILKCHCLDFSISHPLKTVKMRHKYHLSTDQYILTIYIIGEYKGPNRILLLIIIS